MPAIAPLKFNSSTKSFKEMSNTDILNYLAIKVGETFASNTSVGSLAVGSMANGTSIGTWVDTFRSDALGTHPVSPSAITTNSTTLYQDLSNNSLIEDLTRPYGWDTANNRFQELRDSDLTSTVFPVVLSYMTSGGAGGYVLQPTAPATGTWVSRGSLTNTLTNGSTNTTTLWQRTVDSATVETRPIKFSAGFREMSDNDIKTLTHKVRNYILTSGIGKYKLSTTTPVDPGTWVQVGSGFDDTRYQAQDQSYSGTYAQTFTGTYSGSYTGVYSKAFSRNFTGIYNQGFTGSFTGAYGNTFTGGYAGAYVGTYNQAFATLYSGSYTGTFTGTYS